MLYTLGGGRSLCQKKSIPGSSGCTEKRVDLVLIKDTLISCYRRYV
jgi:hypothetical protein